jgi:hypothetical protein
MHGSASILMAIELNLEQFGTLIIPNEFERLASLGLVFKVSDTLFNVPTANY